MVFQYSQTQFNCHFSFVTFSSNMWHSVPSLSVFYLVLCVLSWGEATQCCCVENVIVLLLKPQHFLGMFFFYHNSPSFSLAGTSITLKNKLYLKKGLQIRLKIRIHPRVLEFKIRQVFGTDSYSWNIIIFPEWRKS